MPIFDGSRWDRIRRSGWSGRSGRGRVEVFASVALWAVPLPSPTVYFEDDVLTLGVSVGTRSMGDDLVTAEVTFRLSGAVADALCVVWPGAVEEGGRRASFGRLVASARGGTVAPDRGAADGGLRPETEEQEC